MGEKRREEEEKEMERRDLERRREEVKMRMAAAARGEKVPEMSKC